MRDGRVQLRSYYARAHMRVGRRTRGCEAMAAGEASLSILKVKSEIAALKYFRKYFRPCAAKGSRFAQTHGDALISSSPNVALAKIRRVSSGFRFNSPWTQQISNSSSGRPIQLWSSILASDRDSGAIKGRDRGPRTELAYGRAAAGRDARTVGLRRDRERVTGSSADARATE
jgi:hypothetical protein